MKPLLLTILICFSILGVTAQQVLPLGASMPKGEIKMKDISGSLVSLNEAKTSNGLLVMFSSNTCPYVIKNQSRTNQVCQAALEQNIGVILLNSNDGNRNGGDSYEDMQQYASGQGYKWKYVVDSQHEIADAFGASRTPECYLFDGRGRLIYHGAIDNSPADITSVNRSDLKEAISEMVTGKEVSVKQSRSIGCAIRRRN